MAEEQKTFDILSKGEKKGVAFDKNPVFYETEEECRKNLVELKNAIKLTEDEFKLIDTCISMIDAEEEEIVNFGLDEILKLSELSMKYPDHSQTITACSHFLTNNVDFDGEVPEDIYLRLLKGKQSLSELLSSALKNNVDDISSDEED